MSKTRNEAIYFRILNECFSEQHRDWPFMELYSIGESRREILSLIRTLSGRL